MGIRRTDRLLGASACCRIVLVFFFCVCVLVAADAVKVGQSAAVSGGGGGVAGRWTELTAGSPAPAGADAFRGSKRRIPKGPDPIHNRRAGKTTIAPRRRD
ncbi:hypothetical protein ABZP36_029821 [Zizania latifolia]